MDIGYFIEWFIQETIKIFSQVFTTLNNITFFGTSLLKVSVGILILGALMPLILTISPTINVNQSKERQSKNENKPNEDFEKASKNYMDSFY